MVAADYVELVLTCGSWQEAQRIADALLTKRLVACVEMAEVRSKHWWQGHLNEAKEIRLMMQSLADNFSQVEAEVRNLHSYDTFVLQQIPVTNMSNEAQLWLQAETKKG